MFHYFKGILAYCVGATAVVDCGGVGYKLTVSGTTSSAIAARVGSEVRLYAYLAVREDAMELYGFYTEEELDAYKLLTTVSGIGPKAAISILSIFTPQGLAAAIASGDTRAISRAQGIGGKTAARVVLELKDKFSFFGEGEDSTPSGGERARTVAASGIAEATEVLAVLGFSRAEIATALKKADPTLDSEELVKYALKQLTK
ncbi:MAG: Holliday junction branch migration protein RuvA [Clostridia bacterium]|nr:Holliday junction branch migration protein RuvA [Clostridia bacterium]